MADTKTSGLTSILDTAVSGANDFMIVLDVSDTTQGASGTLKKILVDEVVDFVEANATAFEAVDADILRADTTDVLVAGYDSTTEVVTETATYTPAVGNGASNIQYIASSGTLTTIALPTVATGDSTVISFIVAVATGAGAITVSAFDTTSGDTISTTNAENFLCTAYHFKNSTTSYSHLHVQALQ